jgi:hypothetical protein
MRKNYINRKKENNKAANNNKISIKYIQKLFGI